MPASRVVIIILVHQQIVNYFQEASFSGVFMQGSDGTPKRDMLSSPTTTIQRYFSRIGILSIALFAFKYYWDKCLR